jgi:hypothetical protein
MERRGSHESDEGKEGKLGGRFIDQVFDSLRVNSAPS